MAIDYQAQDEALDEELRAMYAPQEETKEDDEQSEPQTEQDSPGESGTESAVNEQSQDLEESTLADNTETSTSESTVPESRYHNAVVAMNKAQQELAERRKQDAERDSLISQLQSQIQELQAAATSQPETTPPSTPDIDLGDDDELKEAQDLFPEVINPLLKVIANLEKKLAAVSDDVGNVKTEVGNVKSVSDKYRQAEQQSEQEKHISTIKARHPDLEEIVKSDSYADWYYNQSPLIQQLLQEGSAKDVIAALDLFRADHPKVSVPAANKAAQADKLAAARDASIPSIKTGQKPGQRQTFTNAEIAKMSPAEYAKNEAAIDAAMLRGDIT